MIKEIMKLHDTDSMEMVSQLRYSNTNFSTVCLKGSDPNCITGVVNWVHGTYDLVSNGSIIFTPFGDGFQQIQANCAAVSNFIQNYNDTELCQSWRIFQDPVDGYKLHLFASVTFILFSCSRSLIFFCSFDGSPINPQFQVSTTPIMLPTQPLRNVTT